MVKDNSTADMDDINFIYQAKDAVIAKYPVLGLTRFMSLASMIGAIVLPATVLAMAVGTGDGALRGSIPFLVVTGLIAAFVVFRHRGNIARLRRGEESAVGAATPERQD